MSGRWLANHETNPYAAFRLICLPYAGGAASVYRGWQDMAPSYVQVCPIELPGRGTRMLEKPFLRMTPLVRELAHSIDSISDRPFAIFGHSMGGLIAFELARALRRQGRRQADHLFISATAAPGTPRTRPMIHGATIEDVKKELKALNGTPQVLLDNAELMNLMLPTLQADFSVLETYDYSDEPPLPVPMTVFGGSADSVVPAAALVGWRRQAGRGCRLQFFRGDHFFLHTAAAGLIEAICHALDQAAAPQY